MRKPRCPPPRNGTQRASRAVTIVDPGTRTPPTGHSRDRLPDPRPGRRLIGREGDAGLPRRSEGLGLRRGAKHGGPGGRVSMGHRGGVRGAPWPPGAPADLGLGNRRASSGPLPASSPLHPGSHRPCPQRLAQRPFDVGFPQGTAPYGPPASLSLPGSHRLAVSLGETRRQSQLP